MSEYHQGGLIPGDPPTLTRLHPDECLIQMTDAAAMRLRCCRSDHPTDTSDCGKPGAMIEPPNGATT